LEATCPPARGHTGEELVDWFAVGGADALVRKPTPWSASIWAERDLERERRLEAKLKAQQRGYKLLPIAQAKNALAA